MERLAEILAILADAEQVAALTDEQVGELHTEATALFSELDATAESDGVTPELLEQIGQAADCIEATRQIAADRYAAAEQAAADEAAAAEAAAEALAALRARVADGTEPTVEAEAPAEAEVVAEAEAITEEAAEEVAEPVAAGTTTTTAATIPAQPVRAPAPVATGRHAPAGATATQRAETRWHGAGRNAGDFGDLREIDTALVRQFEDLMGTPSSGKFRVATYTPEYLAERQLGQYNDVSELAQTITAAAMARDGGRAMDALTADGGICGPSTPYYQEANVTTTAEPLAAGITFLTADRGGIVWNNPLALTDILVDGGASTGAIGSMTDAQDLAGATNKTYQALACGSTTEIKVDPVWLQLQFGVLQARSNPERSQQFTNLALAAFARYNEQRLWTKLLALATPNNAPQSLGALPDFLTAVNREARNYRGIRRMDPNAVLEIRFPYWVAAGLISDDQVRALKSYPEQYDFMASDLERLLMERNIRVAGYYIDDFTTAISAEGGVNAYPATFQAIISHPGAFVGIDQPELNLGVFRDGTMVNDNVFRTFLERFWDVGMWGQGATRTEFSLCANGATAGTIAPKCGS